MPSPADDFRSALREAMSGLNITSIEDAQAIADALSHKQNARAIDDFAGLSPEQMQAILYKPFDSPHLVTFPQRLSVQPNADIVTLLSLLCDAIGEKGLKATATGNLPRKVFREIAVKFLGETNYAELTKVGDLQRETEFLDLHIARVVGGLAGFVRKYKGSIILSKKYGQLKAGSGWAEIYPQLLTVYALKFNWAYRGIYHEMPFIQHSFLFTLYLLHRFGDEWRENEFYIDAFMTAFPRVVEEAPPIMYKSQEEYVRDAYNRQCLIQFCEYFGLIEVERKSDYMFTTSKQIRLRRTALFTEAVVFHI